MIPKVYTAILDRIQKDISNTCCQMENFMLANNFEYDDLFTYKTGNSLFTFRKSTLNGFSWRITYLKSLYNDVVKIMEKEN